MAAFGALTRRADGLMLRGGLSVTVRPMVRMLRKASASRQMALDYIGEHVMDCPVPTEGEVTVER